MLTVANSSLAAPQPAAETPAAPAAGGIFAQSAPPFLRMDARAGGLLLFLVSLALFAWCVTAGDGVLSVFGTSLSPLSDAGTTWTRGAIHYCFFHEPFAYLYRPSAGLFFGSIYAFAGSVQAIPMFFILWLVAQWIACYRGCQPELRAASAAWLLLASMCFQQMLGPLNIWTEASDFPAFVMTLSGLLLVVQAITRTPAPGLPLAAGCLLLGMSAAVRGPMLLAGPAVLVVSAAFLWRGGRRWVIALGAAMFALPILTEFIIQKHYGIVNNGLINMYCFCYDPQHTWTGVTHARYLALHPSKQEVFADYVHLLLSREGISLVFGSFGSAVQESFSTWSSLPGLLVALGSAAYALARPANVWPARGQMPPGRDSASLRLFARCFFMNGWLPARACFVLLIVLFTCLFPVLHPAGAVLLLVGTLVISLQLRLAGALVFALSYLLGTLFLCLLGLSQLPRLTHTSDFALDFAVLLLLVETPLSATSKRVSAAVRPREWLANSAGACVALSVVGFLYLGSFIIPSAQSRTYHARVEGARAVLKISADPFLDRSLYITGGRMLIYTRGDSLPVGAVRTYQKIEMSIPTASGSKLVDVEALFPSNAYSQHPAAGLIGTDAAFCGVFNHSFLAPARFVDN